MARVNAKSKPRRFATPAQQAQRELAWLLYITEGYEANIAHALAVNAYTLSPQALQVIRGHLTRTSRLSLDLRRQIKERYKWTSIDLAADSSAGTIPSAGKPAGWSAGSPTGFSQPQSA